MGPLQSRTFSHSEHVPAQTPAVRSGLHVELQTQSPGLIELHPIADHLLRIHAGPPARGMCRSDRFQSHRGDIDLFPASITDIWRVEDPSTSLVVRFSPSLLRRATDDIGLDKSHAHLEPRHAFRDPQIEHIAWALHAEQSEGSPGGLVYTETLGLALAIRLLRSHAAVQSFRGGLSKLRLRRLTEHIEAHLDQDLSLRELAAVAGVSVSHLKTQFRHSTGTAVHQYVIQRRVERAKTLLASGKLSISQVALESGFAHQSHMARCMRRILGVTPTALLRG